jgi:hypothetical protein
MPDLTQADIERRIEAQINNERVKLVAAGLNTFGVAAIITTVVGPMLSTSLNRVPWFAIPVALLANMAGLYLIGFLRSED